MKHPSDQELVDKVISVVQLSLYEHDCIPHITDLARSCHVSNSRLIKVKREHNLLAQFHRMANLRMKQMRDELTIQDKALEQFLSMEKKPSLWSRIFHFIFPTY